MGIKELQERIEHDAKYGHQHDKSDLSYIVGLTVPFETFADIRNGKTVEFKTGDMKFENFHFTGDELKFTAIALNGTAYMECKCTPTTKQYRQKKAIFESPAQIFNIFNEACYIAAILDHRWEQAVC